MPKDVSILLFSLPSPLASLAKTDRFQELTVDRSARESAMSLYSALAFVDDHGLSSPGESHPEALPELYVSVSTHTAPVVKNRLRWCSQRASRLG